MAEVITDLDTKQSIADTSHKDAVLNKMSELANVAQFVSFAPDLSLRYTRVQGYSPNHRFTSVKAALEALLAVSPEGSINIRSYTPEQPKSRQFLYGLNRLEEAVAAVHRLAAAGLYTIANETIDVEDGGVSGVIMGAVIEFAPGDTPRCVEKPGTVMLPRVAGLELLRKIYHFHPALDYDPSWRVEFSLHPLKRGFRADHTVVWEIEEVGHVALAADVRWPNRFSRFIGDKAFGLLLADTLGLPVPATTVIARTVAPFSFGSATGTGEVWIRTCPTEQVPGRYTTKRGWLDPFKLLQTEDPQHINIASVLAQEGVEAKYSGALIAASDGTPIIEGIRGFGDEFMLGHIAPQQLPDTVLSSVKQLYEAAVSKLGAIRCEWVFDDNKTWIVQLHSGATVSRGSIIYPGEVSEFHRFDVTQGIEALRELIATVQGTAGGITLVGEVGITSHFGDLLRRAQIPSQLELPANAPL